MAGLVKQVRTTIAESCTATRINKDGCSVSLKGAPSTRLIVDFDKPGSPLGVTQERCDYLFIAEDSSDAEWVCPLELKRGKLNPSKVVDQLRAGAQVAERIVPPNTRAIFRPVAAYGKGTHRLNIRALRDTSNKVSFRGASEPVLVIKCGEKELFKKLVNSAS